MQEKLDYKAAAEQLHKLIRECDADTLAAIYEYAFGAVKNCEVNTNEDCLLITYEEGLEPNKI